MGRYSSIHNRFLRLTIAEKLIAINVLCFVLPFFVRTLLYLFNYPFETFFQWFELLPDFWTLIYRPWTLLTYGFLHSGFGHILWNMVLLYFASQLFLNLFSSQRFINVYFLGILLGGLVFLGSYAIFPVFEGRYPPLVGSSAGVMAVLIFCCTYTPEQEVRLLFFTLKLMYLGIALVILDVLQIPSGNAGGHLAHLGGAALGYVYASQLKKGTDIGWRFELLWTGIGKLFSPANKMKTVYKSPKKYRQKPSDSHQKKIDAILDKISVSGYESLTKEEKDYLFNEGKK